MVSSTFSDLELHREKVIDTINRLGMKAIAMEYDTSRPGPDLIDSSLQMVRDCAGYVAIIGYKYGQVIQSPRNKNGYSLTELEFREAIRLGRPTVVFLMDPEHRIPHRELSIHENWSNEPKLRKFTEFAMRGRLYDVYDCVDDLHKKALQAVCNLRSILASQDLIRQQQVLDMLEQALAGRPIKFGCPLTELEAKALNRVSDFCSRSDKEVGSQ